MMASQRKSQALGKQGEQIAKSYLGEKGYHILETNWHCPRGELDIIAAWGELLVFVEVKTRRGTSALDYALESISTRKRTRLLATIYHYLHDTGKEERDWRLDVIAVLWNTGKPPRIVHVENVLDW